MAMDILNKKVVEANGLLSKIQIGGKVYELKDLIARQSIESLAGIIDALKYVESTGIYANDAAIKTAIEDGDKAIKDYVDAQVGAINKFDVKVLGADEELPTASAETMFVLYLKPEANAESGAYIEYITIRSGEEGAYTYAWEAIGTTAVDLTEYITETELAAELKPINDRLAELGDLANKDEADLDLKALAHKDSASGTVAGETISGVKATGNSAGSINVALEQSEHKMTSAGKFTPVGNVSGTAVTAGSIAVTAKYDATDATLSKGDYTPAGTVTASLNHSATAATLEMSKHAPEGTVSVELSGTSFNKITGVGTQASFKEGAFTPATLDAIEVSANYVEEGLVGEVADECLTFTAAATKALSASKVNSFNGGSKAADEFTANSLPTMEAHNVGVQNATFTGTEHECVTGVKYDKASLSDLVFTGTKAEGALVTGVSYQKADIGSATFTGQTVDINATFSGTEGDVSVDGTCHDYAVKTAEFVPAAIELNVGDITVAAKDVTVQ